MYVLALWNLLLVGDALLNINVRRRILVLSLLDNARICRLPMRGLTLYEE